MRQYLEDLVRGSAGYLELRYHKRSSTAFVAQKGRVDQASRSTVSGIGVRALVDGAWGFASTPDTEKSSIERAIDRARRAAGFLARTTGANARLAGTDLARGDFTGAGFAELAGMDAGDKLGQLTGFEKELSGASGRITNARCQYKELLEEKVVVTSDGASASMQMALPEFSLSAIAEDKGEQISAYQSAGVAGNWQCLFQHPTLEGMVEKTAGLAVDLLRAGYASGGRKTVILAPSVVGLLCHEAVGHTVEADFVKAGSVAKGRIGTRVASDLVNLHDTGTENIAGWAVGNLPFDDEGVPTQNTTIIEKGILKSYLHNRETAADFGTTPTGNSRAWLFNDEPLIRMRNTYMAPGEHKLEDMIAGVDDGYLVEGAGGGQADANGEFMFGCSHIYEIKNGRKGELLREATFSGIAFDVLQTVDAVSEQFRWDLGSGYCGKGQPAKVDAGGPWVRCQVNVGGR